MNKHFNVLAVTFVVVAISTLIYCGNTNAKENIEAQGNVPWVRNSLHGVSFETPEKIIEQESKIPEGYEELIMKQKTYLLKQKSLIVFFMFMDTKFVTYDKKVGLNGAIGNMVNVMRGTDLTLDYQDPDNQLDDLKCSGTFKFKNSGINVKGYVYWNKKGKTIILRSNGHLLGYFLDDCL